MLDYWFQWKRKWRKNVICIRCSERTGDRKGALINALAFWFQNLWKTVEDTKLTRHGFTWGGIVVKRIKMAAITMWFNLAFTFTFLTPCEKGNRASITFAAAIFILKNSPPSFTSFCVGSYIKITEIYPFMSLKNTLNPECWG